MEAARDLGKARVVVAVQHALFRHAIRSTLENDPNVEVIATLGDLEIGRITDMLPDVVLLEEELCGGTATAVIAELTRRDPPIRVLFLDDDDDDATLMSVLEAGASGYLTRRAGVADLLESVRAGHNGETVVPRRMLRPLLDRLFRQGKEQQAAFGTFAALTRRERQILGLLADGATTQMIARSLFISPDTVRTHVHNLLRKLGVHSRLEAASFAREHLLFGPQ